jgi:hypothetical protein
LYEEGSLVKCNGGLNRAFVPHALETFGPLLEFKGLVNDTPHLDFARVQVIDGSREHICFTKRSQDCDP